MATIDPTLASQIEAEYAALFGDKTPSSQELTPEPEAPKPEPIKLPEIAPHPAWPRAWTFGEAFKASQWLKNSGRIDLPLPKYEPEDWPEEARPLIPELPQWWHHNLEVMYALAMSINGNDTTLMTGPTGSGKTSAGYAFAAVLGIPVWQTPCYSGMEDTAFVGSTGLEPDPKTGVMTTDYNPSQLVLSLMHGGIAILDEAFRSRQLMATQSLLEDGHKLVLPDADGLSADQRVLHAPEGKWWIFLTDNTTGTGDHSGSYNAEVQDLSTLDRITNTVFVDYNPPEVESKIIRKAVPALDQQTASRMVSCGVKVREAYATGATLQTMSMRALLSWARKWAMTGDLRFSFRKAFADKLDPDSRAIAGEIFHQVFAQELD